MSKYVKSIYAIKEKLFYGHQLIYDHQNRKVYTRDPELVLEIIKIKEKRWLTEENLQKIENSEPFNGHLFLNKHNGTKLKFTHQ